MCIRDSRIAEQGSHEALLAQNGEYASLWRTQNGKDVYKRQVTAQKHLFKKLINHMVAIDKTFCYNFQQKKPLSILFTYFKPHRGLFILDLVLSLIHI